MAGVYQHFIPRFLQKGFRAPGTGGEVRSWLYDRRREPRKTNLKAIGMEGHFYAVETEPGLDDKIKMAEEKIYAPFIDRFRRGELDGQSVSAIPDLLAHFEIRRRHVRHNMASAGDACISSILKRMADPGTLAQLLRPHLHMESPAIDQVIREMPNADQVKQVLAERPDLLAGFFDAVVPMAAAQIAALLLNTKNHVSHAVRQCHINVMCESVAPENERIASGH